MVGSRFEVETRSKKSIIDLGLISSIYQSIYYNKYNATSQIQTKFNNIYTNQSEWI